MAIVSEFSVALPLEANEVLPVLSDLQLHLSMWSIIESLVEVPSNNEVLANLRIGSFLSKVRLKISTSKEDEVNIVIIEGHDDVNLELRLSVVGRKVFNSPLTLIRGKITVKSANEKALKPHIKEFVNAYQNRLIDTLPAVIETWKKGLAKKAEVAVTPPEKTVVKEQTKQEIKREELPKPEITSVSLAENPTALEDEILLSNIILKSQILSTVREELSGSELLKRLSNMYLETKLKTLYVLAADPEGGKVRVLIRDGVIIGVRIEPREGSVINGSEAVRKLSEVGKKPWRITTYSVSEELAS